MPKNALPMVESGVSTQSTYDRYLFKLTSVSCTCICNAF